MDAMSAGALEPAPSALAPAGCPVAHGGGSGTTSAPPRRSRADRIVRALLRIRERPPGISAVDAHRAFQRSMAISATRCTLTYLVFPIVIPLIGFGVGVGPALGVLIGVVALVCDVFTVRRFFAVDHRYRWQFTAVILGVMVLLTVLLVEDIAQLL
jgi:hypothetical protein